MSEKISDEPVGEDQETDEPSSEETADESSDEEQDAADESSDEEQDAADKSSHEEQDAEEDDGVPTRKQRRAAAKRKLQRQLERRAKQARRRRILTIAGLSAVVVVIVALVAWLVFFDKGSTSSTASTRPTPTPTPNAAPGLLPTFNPPADLGANCTYPSTPQPAAKPVKPPRTGKVPTQPEKISVSMMTNFGPIGIQLLNSKAPCTVNSFASLASQGFFDNTRCHRETTDPGLSILQCGDANATKDGYPDKTGEGGPGYEFGNEYPTNQYQEGDPALEQSIVYPRGTLAMARTPEPNSNGSQFFMVMQDSKLPPQYTVFGEIDATGLATLDKIAQAGVVPFGQTTKPAKDVMITSVRLDY